jgi:hypothetical protein
MFKKDYDEIIREHFDLSDKYTRQYIVSLDEGADQDKLLMTLSSALYDNIVAKVDDIDFGTIPMSRGDITKVEKFEMTEQSLDLVRRLAIEYKQNPSIVDIIITAIQNVKDNKSLFIKGYALNVELPMLMYNLITLCIIRATSMIIATCVKYISDPQTNTMRQALDKVSYERTQDDVMFKQLASFNSLCKDGSMVKMLNNAIKNNGKIHEDAELAAAYDPEMDATNPVATDSDSEEEVVPSPFDTNDTVEPFGNEEEPQVDPAPEAEPAPQEPVPTPDVPEAEPTVEPEVPEEKPDVVVVKVSDPVSEPVDDVPQQAELPQTEPEAQTSEPTAEPPVQQEVPDVNPNPETDADLGPNDAPIIEDEVDPAEKEVPQDESAIGDVVDKIPGEVAKQVKSHPVIAAASAILLALGGFAAGKFFVLKVLIPGLRSMVYTFYYTAFKISDYWQIQAEFLEANADELEMSSDMDEDKKEKVIKKQRKWAERFRKWSNMFNLDKKKTEAETKKAVEKEKKDKKKVGQNDNGEDVLF